MILTYYFHQTLNRCLSYTKGKEKKIRKTWPLKVYSNLKILQYADDVTSILKSEESLSHMLNVVHKFELGSGAKLNTSKSEAIWLGRWRGQGDSPFGLKWVTKIRILGVFSSNGLVSVDDDNWNAKLNKLSFTLGLWKQRDLSFIGRCLIVNVLGASRLWHVAMVIALPTWFND